MKDNLRNVSLRAGKPALALSILLLLAVCADHAAANQQAATAGKPGTENGSGEAVSEMDKLANALTEYCDVYRIEESIIVPLTAGKLFHPDNSDNFSLKGKTLLARISVTLRKYPDNRIYIQEYLPKGNAVRQTKRHAMDRAYVIRSKLINLNIPRKRLIVDLQSTTSPPAKMKPQPQTEKVSLRPQFALHIIPIK